MADRRANFLTLLWQYWSATPRPRTYVDAGTQCTGVVSGRPRDYVDAGTQYSRVTRGRVAKKWAGCKSNKPFQSRGFKNPGNFCYRNSMLQCLVHLPEFCDYLTKIHMSCGNYGECVVCALQSLVEAYWSTGKAPNDPTEERREFNRVLQKTVPKGHRLEDDIVNARQSDPFDFLNYLFECLKACELPENTVKLSDLFDIRHDLLWKCDDCDEETRRPEHGFQSGHLCGLSIDLQDPRCGLSLTTYLRESIYNEKLEICCESGRCIEKSGKNSESKIRSRRRLVTQAPEVLIIRLSRFCFEPIEDSEEMDEVKIVDEIDFEEYLNMGEFIESESPLMYRLEGVVAHSGESIESGHYVAAVRRRDDERSFCNINDGVVTTGEKRGMVRLGKVMELEYSRSNGQDFEFYVLVYRKM